MRVRDWRVVGSVKRNVFHVTKSLSRAVKKMQLTHNTSLKSILKIIAIKNYYTQSWRNATLWMEKIVSIDSKQQNPQQTFGNLSRINSELNPRAENQTLKRSITDMKKSGDISACVFFFSLWISSPLWCVFWTACLLASWITNLSLRSRNSRCLFQESFSTTVKTLKTGVNLFYFCPS